LILDTTSNNNSKKKIEERSSRLLWFGVERLTNVRNTGAFLID